MRHVMHLARTVVGDERGATAIEYALIAGLIAAGLIVAFGVLGRSVAGDFDAFNAAFEAAR